jgi:hypothetical protein
VYWSIHKDNPEVYDLHSLPGCFLVNPLLYPKLDPRLEASTRVVSIHDDVAIVQTQGLVLGTLANRVRLDLIPFKLELPVVREVGEASNLSDSDEEGEDLSLVIIGYAERFAASLRQASKQVEVSTSVVVAERIGSAVLSDPEIPRTDPRSRTHIQKYIKDTAVNWQHIGEADEILTTGISPVYEELLLDAIHAYKDSDYRRALLYSAISIETVATYETQ